MRSFGAVLDRHRGIGPGFDFLRVALAVTILFTHSHDIVTGTYGEYAGGVWQLPVRLLVPMFFALSGFLVTGSAQRLRLKDFILNRALRIVPALAVDIVVAACIIGPIFTTLPLAAYLADPEFHRYFLNVTGLIHLTLPGVFTTNIDPFTVNGSLWTVPFEIGCYVIMSFYIGTGLVRRRWWLVAATLAAAVAIAVAAHLLGHHAAPTPPDPEHGAQPVSPLANFTTAKRGFYLYFYFVAGCFAYLFRERIPKHVGLFALSVVVTVGMCVANPYLPDLLVRKMLVCLPFVTYATLYVGLTDMPRLPLFHRGDYSYGVYLYGFPLQQSLVALFPGRFSVAGHFLCSALLTTGFAIFSWHCVEKPVLSLRRKFSFTARKGEPERQQALPEPEPGSALDEQAREAAPGAPAARPA